MRIIRLLMSVSRPTFAAAILAGILGGSAMTGAIALVNRALDTAWWQQLRQPGVMLAAVLAAAAIGALSYLSGKLVASLMQRSLAGLRNDLCARVLDGRVADAERMGTAAIVNLFTDDLNRVAMGAHALPVLVVNLSICLAALLYLVSVHPLLCAAVIACQLAALALTGWCFQRFSRLAQQAAGPRQALVAHCQLMAASLREFKQNSALRHAFQHDLFAANVQAAMDSSLRVNRYGVGIDAIAKIGFLLTIAVLLWLPAVLPGLAGEAELRSVVIGFLFMTAPLAAAMNGAPQLLEAGAALARIDRYIPPADSGQAACRRAPQAVGLQRAEHGYVDQGGQQGFHIGPIDLTLHRGEIVVLAGGNGSGKSTVAKCLAGLYHLDRGAPTMDGVAVPPAALQSYREQFTALWSDSTPQFCYLPASGVAESAARAWWSRLGLQHCAPYQSGWFDCRPLSAGQRGRAVLAAALAADRPFLIFDEWAANQDRQYRELFYECLLPELRAAGRGILLIAHDQAAPHGASRIVRLDDGVPLQPDHMPLAACAVI